MARATCLLLAGLVVPALAAAQERPVVEIGTSLGLTISKASGTTLTHFGIPGQGILGQPTIYASIFTNSGVVVEPQIAFNVISSEGVTATTVGLGGQLGYLFNGSTSNSPFLAAALGFQRFSGGGVSESDFGVGGKVGYRVLVGTSVGVRVEAGYRRWLDTHTNEITIGMGIGGIVHRPRRS